MLITVLIPTYRRQADLRRCLYAVRSQIRQADSVVVVVRVGDTESRELVQEFGMTWPILSCAVVKEGGVVAAMNAGLVVATGDVLALTDDDAEPANDWLSRIESVLTRNAEAAGVGGRDDQLGVPADRSHVGRLQWFGRVVGNHHRGVGPPREVDVLKGVNCAFRLQPLRKIGFDNRLRGAGAQMHWELSLCLALQRAGWKLIYDPAIRVAHHVAVRHDADQLHRGRFDVAPLEDAVFNETLILASHLHGLRRTVFRFWARAVGTASEPGLLQLPRVLLREGKTAVHRWRATQRARAAGFRASVPDSSH